MLKNCFGVICIIIASIVLSFYSSVVNLELIRTLSNGQKPTIETWAIWIILELNNILDLVPLIINWLILKKISIVIAEKFIDDLKSCSYEKVESDTGELTKMFNKICILHQMLCHLKNLLGCIFGIINNSIVVWSISGHWIIIILCSSLTVSIIDELIHTRESRKNIINEIREIEKIKRRHIELLPEWHASNILNMRESFSEVIYRENLLTEKFDGFWRTKNIIPDLSTFFVSLYFFVNINGIVTDPSLLFLGLTNLGHLTNSAKHFIRNINSCRETVSKISEYKSCVKKLGTRTKSNLPIPKGITQLTGNSAEGKTRLLRKIIENMGDKIVYLSQSDNVNYNSLSVRDSIQFLHNNNNNNINEHLIEKCIGIVGLNKKPDDILERPCGGEVQKIRIARALYSYFSDSTIKIIIMDEPDNNIHTGLDIFEGDSRKGFKQIMDGIFTSLRPKTKLIFTSHKGFALTELNHKIQLQTITELNKKLNLFINNSN